MEWHFIVIKLLRPKLLLKGWYFRPDYDNNMMYKNSQL